MNTKPIALTLLTTCTLILLLPAKEVNANRICNVSHIEPGMTEREFVGSIVVADTEQCPHATGLVAGHVLDYKYTKDGVEYYSGRSATKSCDAFVDSYIYRSKKPGVPEPTY